ncbi:DUF11 domain-containing protein [Candidatus Saccharibacteria bacterium]|nr:MAG: DUF11 domain-containing protein [Candidatus Saccharibacteria bacterium]
MFNFKGTGKRFKKVLTVSAVVLFMAVLYSATNLYVDSRSSSAADCDANAVMYCGAYDAATLKAKYTGDIPSLYDYFGITSSMVNGAASAKSGYVTKDGKVLVDGKVVANNAVTVGRQYMPGSTTIQAGGKTFYQRPPSVSFASTQISAFVWLDAQGRFVGAVIKSCGNPVKAQNTVVVPVLTCDDLKLTPNNENRTVNAVVKYTAKDGATYKNTTLVWGDGSQNVITGTTGNHTYAAAGTYTVQANMLFTVNGTDKAPAANVACSKTVTFTPPPVQKTPSVKIDKKVEGKETVEVEVGKNYNYQIKVTNDGEVDLKNVAVTDTPASNTNIQLVSANGVGTITSNTWNYVIPSLKIGESMSFTLTAKVTKYTEGTLNNTACVNATEVPNQSGQDQDDCDDATVTVKTPQ